ncbi:hypothetical protein C8J56DRAFT_889748 [Mycena floridula]|nr:hypothetical protein C8J56DRAFT_889748 [Mycena floridula]
MPRAASSNTSDDEEAGLTKDQKYYHRHQQKRKAESLTYYKNKGSDNRKTQRQDQRITKRAAAAHQPTPEPDEPSLAFITIKRTVDEAEVWLNEFGGVKKWAALKKKEDEEADENDNEETELGKHLVVGRSLLFWLRHVFDNYEKPKDVDEAVEIFNNVVQYEQKISLGIKRLL